MSEETKWSVADADGNIDVPDYLDPLFNKIGMQMRFHTISNKNEMQTIADMVFIAEKFFNSVTADKQARIDELEYKLTKLSANIQSAKMACDRYINDPSLSEYSKDIVSEIKKLFDIITDNN